MCLYFFHLYTNTYVVYLESYVYLNFLTTVSNQGKITTINRLFFQKEICVCVYVSVEGFYYNVSIIFRLKFIVCVRVFLRGAFFFISLFRYDAFTNYKKVFYDAFFYFPCKKDRQNEITLT